ncbi:MAG TPA: tRNA-uridine aminocarboxypropyltransferase [Rectinemataceae bacterium]|nr:tRNA-uridine aminocarboxypropyltransferase [Rectinemataceae bacterium]
MPREFCLRCRRPLESCLCPRDEPMDTKTRIVLLMHPKEFRRTKCTTGRITTLNLRNSEILVGLDFAGNGRIKTILGDPESYPVLLYPGEGAADLSTPGGASSLPRDRRLVVFLIDATWACSRSLLRANSWLLQLPRVMFSPREPSRWVIKRQPAAHCLSTLESVHELLLALDAAGLDTYPDKERLLERFAALQAYQLERATAAGRRIQLRNAEPASE